MGGAMKTQHPGPLLLAAALATAAGCRPAEAPAHVLLVTLDTLRADYVGYVGAAKAETPNLDALARRGIAFRDTTAEIPSTLPSHASLMYGLPPHALQNYNNGQTLPAPKGLASLAEEFKAAGYVTAAFVSLGVLGRHFGLDRGFDVYESDFPKERWYLDAGEVNSRVLPWLEGAKDWRFFAWIHYSDPHDPYAPPATPNDLILTLNGAEVGRFCLAKYMSFELDLDLGRGDNVLAWSIENAFPVSDGAYLARFDRLEFTPGPSAGFRTAFGPEWEIRAADGVHFAKDNARITIRTTSPRRVHLAFRGRPIWSVAGVRAMYRREVEFLDRELGRLWAELDELGLWDSTLIVAVGDHGEGLGEFIDANGEPHFGHIHYLYSYYLRVPLIVVDPRRSARGIVRDDPATLLDVFPTIARRAGFKTGRRIPGRSLWGPPAPAKREIFTETYRPEAVHDKFGLRRFPWHLILTPGAGKLEVYDLQKDPEECRNLLGAGPMPEDARPLQPVLEARAREILNGKTEIKIDKRAEDMLRGLGYIK
jgi:arylsulfatase A-like enzyme